MGTANAQAFSNIAFIKYWGNRDERLRLPANGSISMNLDGLYTRTRVDFVVGPEADELTLDGQPVSEAGLGRVNDFLDLVRQMAGLDLHARVDSRNNFPTGAGIASSASAFAALSLAASAAAGLALSEAELSRLARRGSGSACRSVPDGFVEWQAGEEDEGSYAISFAPPEHWELVDCVAIVSRIHKITGSTEGHTLAWTSPLQASRVADAPRRLDLCRRAILERDFDAFATIVELDSNLMHSVMMTSTPPLQYWQPATLEVMRSVGKWRQSGLPVCYTIDAGPNVHVLCLAGAAPQVAKSLGDIPGVESVLTSRPGGSVKLLEESLSDGSIGPSG